MPLRALIPVRLKLSDRSPQVPQKFPSAIHEQPDVGFECNALVALPGFLARIGQRIRIAAGELLQFAADVHGPLNRRAVFGIRFKIDPGQAHGQGEVGRADKASIDARHGKYLLRGADGANVLDLDN